MSQKTYKIDKIDQRILYELDKNARISNSKLAKILRRSRETVTYRISRLVSRGIIERFITSINPHKLGFQLFKIFLQLENIPEERERFYQFLKNHKELYWMGICDGAWDIIFEFFSKDAKDFYDLKNLVFSDFRNLIVKKETGTLVDVYQYPKKFFIGDKNSSEEVVWAGVVENPLIDVLDKKVLDILINNARMPVTMIAKKVGSTVEVVSRRMKKLKDLGIIIQYRISIDFHKLGKEFYKAIIYFKSISAKQESELKEYMRKHPESVYLIRNITPWEVECEFIVDNYTRFNEITNDMRMKFCEVIRNIEVVLINKEWWMPGYEKFLLEE